MKWETNDISHIYCNCSNFTDGVCIRNDGPLYDAHWCLIAMILSLFVALTVTPYLGYHLLQEKRRSKAKDAEGSETSQVYKIYNRLERPLLESSMKEEYLWE
jgi:Cu/Ag efflux pump CusA